MESRLFTVEKLVHGGMGIVRDGKHTIFVSRVIPGEEVKIRIVPESAKPTLAVATEIVSPSPNRIEPKCPHFGKCGGCQFQHIDYKTQLAIKKEVLTETLARIAQVEHEVKNVLPSEKRFNYRSRIRLHVVDGRLGFFAEKKQDFVEIKHCHLADERINKVLDSLQSLIKNERPGGIELIVEQDGLLTVVLDDVRGRKIYRIGNDNKWEHKPNRQVSFQQVNQAQNKVLRDLVAGLVKKISPKGVIELYAGNGNLTEVISPHCSSITAVDGDKTAVEMGREKLGEKAEFVRAKCEEFVNVAADKKQKPDLVVLDPPRTGAKETIKGIIRLEPKHIIYVSCDPATFARDLRMLSSAGYKLESLTSIDMFPQTAHIESVAVISAV